MKGFDVIKSFAKELIEILVLFIALGVLAQITFGDKVTFFDGVVTNLMNLITQFGSNGLVGLIALLLIVSIYKRNSAPA
ncbi:MAG: hypothetical protein P8J59_01015 [Phycisphaerales bacterium]|jgi:hypothetical protein|nr:hypothetical protein [Phycisphaerales bacterium]